MGDRVTALEKKPTTTPTFANIVPGSGAASSGFNPDRNNAVIPALASISQRLSGYAPSLSSLPSSSNECILLEFKGGWNRSIDTTVMSNEVN